MTENDPALLEALDALVEPETRGDPMTRLRWTTKSTRNLADELTRQGHPISHHNVGRLLTGPLEYSLQANASRTWRPTGQPRRVDAHDVPGEQGKAIPYGVYDLGTDTGWVSVGNDGDTATFATETIRRWWTTTGALTYPAATRLLITADAGGSNGYRLRLWKKELAALADQIGIPITVCHMPPGTSKWNRKAGAHYITPALESIGKRALALRSDLHPLPGEAAARSPDECHGS